LTFQVATRIARTLAAPRRPARYSSLAYVTRLSIDGFKVDRSFVQAPGRDQRSTTITTAIVRMAHALSVEVIAEGVETEGQLRALRDLDCELAQGFYPQPPLGADEVSEMLSAGRPNTAAQRGASVARMARVSRARAGPIRLAG
jgi:sensor c-di-GMP phosphodiesterase-like protein